MLLELFDSYGEYFTEFLLELKSNPSLFLLSLIAPLTICFVYLFLRFNVARVVFFVVGALFAKILIMIAIHFFPFASLFLLPQKILISLVGAVIFCALLAYICFKTFIIYDDLNNNVTAKRANWQLFSFGVCYAFCFIGESIDYLALFASVVYYSETMELISLHALIFIIQVAEIVLYFLIAIVFYLLIKIVPFKNAKRIAFLVLGIGSIIYLPLSILLSAVF